MKELVIYKALLLIIKKLDRLEATVGANNSKDLERIGKKIDALIRDVKKTV